MFFSGRWCHWKLHGKRFWTLLWAVQLQELKWEKCTGLCVQLPDGCVSEGKILVGKQKWQTVNEEAITIKKENFSLHRCLCELNHPILQNASCPKEQPVGFITVFPEVRSAVRCQELSFCWAFHVFLGWHRTTDNKCLQASRSCLKLRKNENFY